MKKTLIALLLTGLLAGCSNTNTKQANTPADNTPSSKTSKTDKTSDKAESKKDDDKESTSSSSAESSAKTEKTDTYADLTAAIKDKNADMWLPQAVTTDAAHVNATMTTEGQTTTVKFYGADDAVDLNDAQAANGQLLYTLTKTTYASADDALTNINWQDTDKGLPTVDLGDNQVATKEGAAGSTYLHWNEGNWSLTVRASNVNGQDPTDLGKQLVELFRTKALPAPSAKGAVNFNVADGTDAQSIAWNDGASVYTLTGADALKTAQTAIR